MKHQPKSYFFILLFLLHAVFANAQQDLPVKELEEYKAQTIDLVAYLQFTLNTLGEPSTTAKEKDIIINQSYIKLFRDDKVQVEDDLDENRDVVANKDVQAYLKDIDFFFKQVLFEINVEEVSHEVNDLGQVYFKVTANRNLRGITIDNDTVNVNKPRYIEVNLDRESRDLKIASIYTTRLSEEEELNTWWKTLSLEWQGTLRRQHQIIEDTLTLEQLKVVTNVESLDISGNDMVSDLTAVSKLTKLRKLNISDTRVVDLVPLRNLTKLEVLDCSQTLVSDLSPLKYCTNLREIYCNGSLVNDLLPVSNFTKLEKLYAFTTPVNDLRPLSNLNSLQDLRVYDTPITDLTPLASLKNLEILRFSYTQVADLLPIAGISSLERLYFEYTRVTDLAPLQNLSKLKQVYCDGNEISSLAPLNGLSSLEKIYSDNTLITREEAARFMNNNRNALVVYETEQLFNWWKGIDNGWKKVFASYVKLDATPTKEQLQTVANLAEIDVSGKADIITLEPLKEMAGLKVLLCPQTSIKSLAALNDLIDLEKLDCTGTALIGNALEPIKGLASLKELNISKTGINAIPFGNFVSLETFKADDTGITTLNALSKLKNLREVYCDNTKISATSAASFVKENPQVMVIYQTEELQNWWQNLDATWKGVFAKQAAIEGEPDRVQLQQVINLKTIEVEEGTRINSLQPVAEIIGLEELKFSNTAVSSLQPLSNLLALKVLECPKNPIYDIEPLVALSDLQYLNFENTPVKKLDPLEGLKNLEIVKCSATQIKSLSPLEDNPNLKRLECYNTKVSGGKVKKFRSKMPNTEVVHY